MQRPSEVETAFIEYTRAIMVAKYKIFVVMNGILCPIKSYLELATQTRLTTIAENTDLVIADFGVSCRIMGPTRSKLNLTT